MWIVLEIFGVIMLAPLGFIILAAVVVAFCNVIGALGSGGITTWFWLQRTFGMNKPPIIPIRESELARAAREAYQDDSRPARYCDHCGTSYRGPTPFCSLQCAVEHV